MTKITLLLGALLCFSVTSLNAQINYDLKDFQSPEVKYQGLETDLHLSGNTGHYGSGSEHANSFSGSGNLSYFRYQNTDKYIGRHLLDFFGRSRTFRSESPFFKERSHFSLSSRLDARTNNQFYWEERSGFFLQADGIYNGGLFNSGQLQSNDEDSVISNTTRTQYNHFATVKMGVGYGRIEPVRFARLAYDMYAMLSRKNLIADPTEEQIENLADVMVDVVNTRFFDSRFKTIYQLEQIDSTLRAQGLVGEMPVSYFAQLADVWNSANSFQRGSGKQVSIGYKGVYSFDALQQTDELSGESLDTSTLNFAGLLGYISYVNEKPLSIKWQRSIELNLEFGDVRDRYEPRDINARLQGSYSLGWYPNTRTSLDLRMSAGVISGRTVLEDDGSGVADQNFTYLTALDGSLYYWITPRFRLSGRLQLVYGHGRQNEYIDPFLQSDGYWWGAVTASPNFNLTGNLSLSYAIF